MRIFTAALLALLMSACQAPSLHPLYLPADKLTVPGFEGKWADEKHNVLITVHPPDDFAYEIEMQPKELSSPWQYEARLVKLGAHVYADMLLKTAPNHFDGCIGCIPAHSFWRLNLDGDSMKPAYLDSAWLNKYLKANPKSIAHVWSSLDDENLAILTAPMAVLRAFVTKVSDQKGAMSEWETLHRCAH
ncbi:MAG: hypothetical protein ABI972_12375 [Acidobacteriota bacterium]